MQLKKRLAELQTETRKHQTQIDVQASENKALKEKALENQSYISELESLKKECKKLIEWKEKSRLEQAKLEAEVAVRIS